MHEPTHSDSAAGRSTPVAAVDRCPVVRRLRRDGRGASEVVGTILIFGLLMMLLVLIQTNAVPAQNAQIEFDHNQRVQGDLLELDRAILATATDDVPASTQLEVAVRYPSRFFLLNPPVRSGRIETVGDDSITISNAVAPSAPTYWDGSDRSFETTLLRYQPGYNEYRNAPVTVYEHNTLVNQFDSGAALPVGSGSFVQGNQLLLVTLDGRLATATSQSIAVETTALSGPTAVTTIRNDDPGGITVTLPTTLTEAQWELLLDDETVPNGGQISDISVTPGTDVNTLAVTLEPGEYELRMGRVGLGRGFEGTVASPHYVTAVDGQGDSLGSGETRSLVARTTDRYNNPATGAVTFSTSDGSFVRADGSTTSTITVTSDDEGRARATFAPASGMVGTATVTAQQDFDGDGTVQPRERATFDLTVTPSGSVRDDLNGVAGVNPWAPGTVRLESVSLTGNTVSLELYNDGSTDREIVATRLSFYVANNGQPATYGRINNDPRDQIDLYGDWDETDQTIRLPGNDRTTIDIRFSQANPQDFFGIAVEYEGTTANYYVQIPPF